MKNTLIFLCGVVLGALTPAVSAQAWDMPAEFRALREAIQHLTASLNVDGEAGEPAPKAGPVLHLVGPDGTVVPASATSDGRLRVEITLPR